MFHEARKVNICMGVMHVSATWQHKYVIVIDAFVPWEQRHMQK